jgi:hypothetical protein
MTISVNDFRVAAQQLGDNANLRLKEDGSGIATSGWERFKVGFFDLFRSADSIAAKQTQTIRTFLDAVRREQGPNMANIAERHLQSQLDGVQGVPLLARAVSSTSEHLSARGGPHWVRNEQLTRQAAHFTGPSTPQMPTLSGIVNPVCEELVAQAQELGYPEDKARELLLKYTVGLSQFGNAAFDMPKVSRAIENALRDAARVEGEQGVGFRSLTPDQVTQIAGAAAREQICYEINGYFHELYISERPFADDFASYAEAHGMGEYLPIMTEGRTLHQFRELESFAIQNATEPLSPERMTELREQVFERIFTRQQEKLDQIGLLDLADGPARSDMLKTCLGSRARMDAHYFAQMQTAAEQIGQFAEQIAVSPSAQEQHEAALELGKVLAQSFTATGAQGGDDAGNFMVLAFDLFAARQGEAGLDRIADWMAQPQTEAVREGIIDLTMSENQAERTAASSLLYLFSMFGKTDDYR